MSKKIILTGERPTGKLHLGHLVGALKNRIELQNSGEYELNIIIADIQALTDNYENPKKIRDNVLEVVIDNLSVGIDPNKSTIFIQSMIPALFELPMYYSNLVTLSRLQRNPTVKSELQEKGMDESIPVGFLTYPISQAADITAFNANLVPVGIDQSPVVEQTKEIVKTFNRIYNKEVLVDPTIMIPNEKYEARLPGLDGNSKMSKSLGNCIFLADDEKTVNDKVMTMYTDPNHVNISDPGNTKDNPVFIYLSVFCNDTHFEKYLTNYKNLDELKAHYEKGGLGDVVVKKFLAKVINDVLEPIREKRKYYEKNIDEVYKILKEGTEKAVDKTNIILKNIRDSIGINYFEDDSFINEFKDKYKN